MQRRSEWIHLLNAHYQLFSLPFHRTHAAVQPPIPEAIAPKTSPPPVPSAPAPVSSADTIVKQMYFVNEKKDVGLQISRSDFPSSSNQNKSAQTRWTSTKTRPSDEHYSRGRYLRTIEDPSLDDPTIASYRPPPLYFNSDSDFLQMITPATTKHIDDAKENRLAYLASIPIDSFDDGPDDGGQDENETHPRQPKTKPTHNVRFNLPSSSSEKRPPTRVASQQKLLGKDFLQNFPLLRSLVQEALALQQSPQDMPTNQIVFDQRPHSAAPQGLRPAKQGALRPKSSTHVRSTRTKSVIVAKNMSNARRLYPQPPATRQTFVTRGDVRNLVDRLSQPKFNKRLERELAVVEQMIDLDEPIITPRVVSKLASAPVFVMCFRTD